jgi:hypothetical protein
MLSAENRLRGFENGVLGEVFGTKGCGDRGVEKTA